MEANTDSAEVTLDIAVMVRPRLFADLAMIISSYGCDIVETRLWQSQGGQALFRIRVEGGFVRNCSNWLMIYKLLPMRKRRQLKSCRAPRTISLRRFGDAGGFWFY